MPVGAGRPWRACEPAGSQASSKADPHTAWELMATAWREGHLPREEKLWNRRRKVKGRQEKGRENGGRQEVRVFSLSHASLCPI